MKIRAVVIIVFLSAFFEATRQEYYQGLKDITNYSDWHEWFLYFLAAVYRQSEDALSRTTRINQILLSWKKELIGARSKTAIQAIDLIGSNPFVTAQELERKFQVSFTTAMRAIEYLEKKDILIHVQGDQRNRVFCAQEILDVLEEPTTISPNYIV